MHLVQEVKDSQSYSQAQVYTTPCMDGSCGHGGRWGQNELPSPIFEIENGVIYIGSKI